MAISITIPPQELFDEQKNEFINIECEETLTLEHSLVSISKWESKWHKIYLDPDKKVTDEEAIDYLRCMTINRNVDPLVYRAIPQDEINRINDYINDPMTATTFKQIPQKKTGRKPELNSSELLYYYMFKLGIPKECEKWHINRLMTLMNIYAIKDANNNPNNKQSRSETLARYREINRRNKARFNTRG